MKRFLLSLFLLTSLMAGFSDFAQAQAYHNEWINYGNTYFKFKVLVTGVYRISQATLSGLGLGGAPAEQFQLWRNGEQVPLYTSVQTGPMGGSDYIEFWGERGDGKPDKELYRDPESQLIDEWGCQTDTAAFFLTLNPSGVNLRLTPTNNDIAGNTLLPEPFFMHTAVTVYGEIFNAGYAAVVGSNVYSSAYDVGEGYTSGSIYTGGSRSVQQANLNVYTGPGAPEATFKINAEGTALNPRQIIVKLNGDTILNQAMDFFDYVKATAPVTLAQISSGTANYQIINGCTQPNDHMVVAKNELVYPRQFNFGNARNFYFELPANSNGNYLEISNFNYNGVAPVLIDLTNDTRYIADISDPSLVKIALLPSLNDRKLVLVSQDAGNIAAVTSFKQRNFVDFHLAANQGNYLIISNPLLTVGTGGINPVDNYRAYRSSAAGGGYNARVYMIDELVDQFGFGILQNPLGIRNFIRWARNNFSTLPIKDVFLIGKGITYDQYRIYRNNPNISKLALVPTFGQPGSDNLLAADPGLDEIPKVPIGRLSVVTGDEITIYLNKVQQYELAQATPSPAIADKAWMKNVAHVIGASDENLQDILDNYMEQYRQTVIDTFYGANVSTFSKTSADVVQQANNTRLQNLFQQGLGLVTYFGHSSATTLEYNLDDPQAYNNPGKYPLFILLGCNAGNFFNFNLARLQTKETISEKYVLAQERGGIASIASTSLGIVHYLDIFNSRTYKAFSNTKYGKTLGEIMIESATQTYNLTSQNDFYARLHCEQSTLHGDPALKMNSFPKPDYVIEDPLVKISPSFVSVAETSFKVDASFMNLGSAIDKKIVVEVKRTYPDLTTHVIERDTIPGIRFIDSLTFNIPIVATRDKGLNKVTITVDADNAVDELFETNNSITKDVFIFEDEAKIVSPANYAIINQQNIHVFASTADAFSVSKQYNMEMDTTELFNSPLKIAKSVTSTGGLLEFTPGITFLDSTVYYWRVAPEPVTGSPVWNTSSFIYLPNSEVGFNQSHYYQHLKSDKQRIQLNPLRRDWEYDSLPHFLYAKNGVFLTATSQEGDIIVSPDGDPFIRSACVGYSLIFNIFDPLKFKPNLNLTGQYGSAGYCAPGRQWNYEYSYMTPATRKLAMDFMDSIPNGYFVVVRNILNSGQSSGFVNDWKADTTLYGQNNSLYHKLKAVGFNLVDSFTSAKAFIHIYQKNNNGFTPVSTITNGIYDLVSLTKDLKTPDTLGYITSPLFGRAKAWKKLLWKGSIAPDITPGDLPTVDVIGVDVAGNETTLFTGLDPSQQDYDISGVSATQYPYLKLKMRNIDSVNFTPYQLQYWRVTDIPIPEGAIAPNIYLKMKDTLEVGEPLDFKVAFKNISSVAFDSLKIKMIITDKNNVPHIIPIPRQKPLLVNDTLQAGWVIDTKNLGGVNTMYVEVNPDDDQPEQYHYNNFAYRNFYVRPDSLNPLLDVTFDGVHILNRDIVSSKPDIIVKLKDEAKWLILDDTSLLTLQVRFPDGSLRKYSFNNDTLQFTPAGQAPNPDNTATISFRPYFLADGEYQLIVNGKDKSDNNAGSIEYRVSFQVINKPMISNMLNYPNPFTTSTAFVFTITGSEVPQNIKIEIMTITGKIVREITKNELGDLHIGRNITEFKWDGTDQYGQKLANGIYLYRVVTNLNGKTLDKYKADDDNTDKYFNKGYGKMYLMR
jgi:Peptidase family C25